MYKYVLYYYNLEHDVHEPSKMTSNWNLGHGLARLPHDVKLPVCEAHEVEGGGSFEERTISRGQQRSGGARSRGP
jgi:hypothetical protein